jgi:hypothetical protein
MGTEQVAVEQKAIAIAASKHQHSFFIHGHLPLLT